jgi:peroxiredoxin/outer membrane lipoprotein-sorting protein
MPRIALFLVLAAFAMAAPPDVSRTVNAIGERCQKAREYAFEGELYLAGQKGSAPGKALSHAKIKLASAPAGKYYLRVEPEGKDSYVLLSNGEKSWAWVPKLKQYTEEQAGIRAEDEDGEEGGSDSERDLAEVFVHTVMPALARLHVDAQSADFNGEAAVKFENRNRKWPVLRVLSRPGPDNSQTFTQLAIDPETLAIGRIVHSTVLRQGGEKTLIELTLDFTSFQIGSVAESTFEFEAPKGAKLVDAVPIPDQTGSFLLKQPAPDFDLKTLDGENVRLSDLRGHPVLLSFWASWCLPCRRELPLLSALHQEYKDKGLVVVGVNDEGRGTARKYADQAGLTFQTLDDSGLKAHRLYRVRSIPTLFLIDKDGKVVRFMRGAKEPAAIRASLATVGL